MPTQNSPAASFESSRTPTWRELFRGTGKHSQARRGNLAVQVRVERDTIVPGPEAQGGAMHKTPGIGAALTAIVLGFSGLTVAAAQGTGAPAPLDIPKTATALEGIPSVRVDLSEAASQRRVLGKDEAAKNKMGIQVKNGQFFWASQGGEPLALNRKGEFTFLSATPGNYITLRKVNDRLTYVEHLDNKGQYITYFGELRVVVGK